MRAVETANGLDLKTFVQQFLPTIEHVSSSAVTWDVVVESASSISAEDIQVCFELVRTTSKDDYAASSMGWHPRTKLKEMKLPDLRYLLIRDGTSNLPVAFASFMMTYEDGEEVVYVYEIHVSAKMRNQGLGKKLMSWIEEAGRRAHMKKAMLTVFTSNQSAAAFYSKLGYELDESSPGPRRLRNGIVKEADYSILSKNL